MANRQHDSSITSNMLKITVVHGDAVRGLSIYKALLISPSKFFAKAMCKQ
jgi:hypothetical protein